MVLLGLSLADEYNLGEEYSDIFRSILYDYDDPQMAAEHALTHLGIL